MRVKETSKDLRRDVFLKDLRNNLVRRPWASPLSGCNSPACWCCTTMCCRACSRSQILTLGAVFLAILVMFLVLFRSLSLALIALAPNMLAAGLVLGVMGLAGIPLDIMTITIAAIVVGIGVDDCIHYVHRFMHEFPVDRNYPATMYRCHNSIGRAMYYTTVTVVVGFSMLTLSNFTPSIYFGLLTVLAMVAAVLGALLLLPLLIILFKPLGPEAELMQCRPELRRLLYRAVHPSGLSRHAPGQAGGRCLCTPGAGQALWPVRRPPPAALLCGFRG